MSRLKNLVLYLRILTCFYLLTDLSSSYYLSYIAGNIACSRRSDSGARAKNEASERARKKTRGDFFPALSLALFFARAPLSERLEQASSNNAICYSHWDFK